MWEGKRPIWQHGAPPTTLRYNAIPARALAVGQAFSATGFQNTATNTTAFRASAAPPNLVHAIRFVINHLQKLDALATGPFSITVMTFKQHNKESDGEPGRLCV